MACMQFHSSNKLMGNNAISCSTQPVVYLAKQPL
jgi:hypothetical protein